MTGDSDKVRHPLERVSRHPLTLLVAGALLSAGFGGFLADRWQDQEQALAVKRGLVERMTTATANLVAAVQAHEFHPRFETPERYAAHYLAWDAESQAIQGEIATYLSGGARREWARLSEALLAYYNLGDQPGWEQPSLRRATLTRVVDYVGGLPAGAATSLRIRPKPGRISSALAYQEAWRALKLRILLRRDAIVDAVLEGSIRTG